MRQGRVLLGISLFWLALSMVFDGINTLVLPRHVLGLVDAGSKATVLGLVSFVGLVAGVLVQPVAGAFSDRRGHRRLVAQRVPLRRQHRHPRAHRGPTAVSRTSSPTCLAGATTRPTIRW